MENLSDILDQLVADLTNPERELKDIFLKAKVLAFRLKNQRFKDWVEKEINGYDENDEKPEYRLISTAVYGNMIQDLAPVRVIRYTKVRLVIDYISQESYDKLTKYEIGNSISEIEQFIKAGTAHINVPHDLQMEISATLLNNWHVESAFRVVDVSHLTGVLNSIKSHLLDFVLEINETSGSRALSLTEHQKQIDDVFRNTIGNISATTVSFNIGDKNNNLSTGNISNSTVSQNITNNYNTEEIGQIRELVSLIRSDLQNLSNNEFKDRIESELTRIEKEAEKPSPMKLIINSALNVVYALLIETAGAAYSPIILGKLQMLMTM